MVERLGSREGGGLAQLPQRRWRIRPPRAFVQAAAGAAVAAAIPFLAWWFGYLPPAWLWVILLPMVLGWWLALPRSLYLALDERGVALIQRGWGRDSYVWIPYNRLISLEMRPGWLVATGTTAEHQGSLDWLDVARRLGVQIPTLISLYFQMSPGGAQLAAPILLLDQLARDEIELWMYRQGKQRRSEPSEPPRRPAPPGEPTPVAESAVAEETSGA